MKAVVRWLACLILVAATAGAVQAQDKPRTKVRFGILTTASQAAFYIGVKKGIFARHGFDVEVKPLATGVQANQALAANQVDWSGGGVESTVVAWAAGLPLTAYAMYAKGGDSYGILVRTEAKIRVPADLKGKRIAVPQGTAPAQGLSQVLVEAGLPSDAVLRVNANYANMGPMLIQGAVDAMVGLEPFLTLTQEQLADKATMLLRLGGHVQGGGFFLINNAWASANRDRIADAVAALWEAQQWTRQNPTEAAAIEAEFLAVEPRIVEIAMKFLAYDPVVDTFTQGSLRKTSDYLAREGLIPKPIDPEGHLKELTRVFRELQPRHGKLLE